MRIKKSTLIKLHVYAGLFTAVYLLAFGVSSLVINHRWQVDKKAVTRTWEAQLAFDAALPDKELAAHIRDELNLMGWIPWWKYQRDSVSFRFLVGHLGTDYQISADLLTQGVKVEKIPKGFWAVFHGLHFLNGNIPNAPFIVRTWALYQWLTLTVMVISLILGLWLWLKFSFRRWHLWVFGGLFVGSIALMVLLS